MTTPAAPQAADAPAEIDVSFQGHVAIVEIRRPPHNYFDTPMITGIADAFEDLEANPDCRAIVLCSQGASFCAGANFSNRDATPQRKSPRDVNPIYFEAIRLFSCVKPVVCAVQGAAIGGGLGLALVGDFRVSCAEGRFSANFNRLGFHPGFGLSHTLPRLIGNQKASLLFFTGRRVGGEEALKIGLVDELVPQAEVRARALALATEIAVSSPLAVQSTRATLRRGLVEQVRLAVAHESAEQNRQFKTEDFKEGVKAMAERRDPRFQGR
jgi:enoyl-CoA hydratase/carnithine racemase